MTGNDDARSSPQVSPLYVVPVRCDLAAGSLQVERPLLRLQRGEGVIWSFDSLPADFIPLVEFQPGSIGEGPYGPFRSLRQVGNLIIGEGAGEGEGETVEGAVGYLYRVVAARGFNLGWREPSAMVCSAAATLVCGPGEPQKVTVTVTPASDGKSLEVAPRRVTLAGDEVIVWDFSALEMAGLGPRIRFYRFDPHAEAGQPANLHFGPFRSLFYGSGTDVKGIMGAGNNEVRGIYYYEVSAVSVNSGTVLWLSSGDPTIDNRGDPAPGG